MRPSKPEFQEVRARAAFLQKTLGASLDLAQQSLLVLGQDFHGRHKIKTNFPLYRFPRGSSRAQLSLVERALG